MVKTIGNVQKDAQVRAVASGALSNGDTVIVNSDGTVSVVSGSSASAGTPVVFEAASTNTYFRNAVFDSNSNKVVIAYRDTANSNYGTAIVGTVSGSSISFGTPTVFFSALAVANCTTFDSSNNKVVVAFRDNTNKGRAIVGTVSGTSISFGSTAYFKNATVATSIGICFDSSANKVVVSYTDIGNSLYGTAVVGTVSGTSISFGTSVVYESANSQYSSNTFDTTNNKVVIAYVDYGNSSYGTGVVGTVSGTSISFGTPVVFNTGSTEDIDIAFDSSSSKVVVSFRDIGNSNYGTAVVGTVSGTSISFGSEVVFTESRADYPSITYDSTNNRIVIAYRDNGNSNYGTVVEGQVSGTSISFETPIVFEAAAAYNPSITFDSNAGKSVISYYDNGNSNYGTAVVYSVGTSNLTSDNFIGFADGSYADTQSAVINTTCSVDRNQTSLTAGQKYYVQTDGALGLTPADPSVEAGTAISSTEILVKG